jgi:hypothetical protein
MLPPFPTRRRNTPGVRGWWAICLGLAVALSAAACERVPLVAPTQSTIVVYATTPVIALNGSTQVTASLVDSTGTPVSDGTVVTFTTTLGSVSPVEVRTRGGKAVTLLQAGNQAGAASVTAMSGTIVATPLVVTILAPTTMNVSLAANSTTPTLNTPVLFTVTVTPSSTLVDHVNWDFGDGETAQTNGLIVSHVFATRRRFVVAVTVTAVGGIVGYSQTEVVVQ